jgi:hypothetical protein
METKTYTNGTPAPDRSAINLANSKLSTGPRTPAGKKRSALNALRHGLTGQTIVMPHEDLAAYESHCKRYLDEFHPKGALEEQLVQSIADTTWRLNRIAALENNIFTLASLDDDASLEVDHPQARRALAVARAFPNHAAALSNMSMHEERLSRRFDRTVKQLRETQSARKKMEQEDLRSAARLLEMHKEEEEIPYEPAQDGFVFSTSAIETFINRRDRIDRSRTAESDRTSAAG